MSSLALILLALPGGDPAPAQVQKPEVALFARAFVVGSEMTDGYGLQGDLGAPGSLVDILDASLLFARGPIEKRTFPSTSVAPQQIRAAIDAQATIIIALDYLQPYIYAETGGEEGRRASLDLALRNLEAVQVPLVLGDVPDLTAALSAEKPILFAKQMPSPQGLKAVNERIAQWAREHKNVTLAPVSAMFAHVNAGEPFNTRRSSWPAAWLPDLLMKDRMHTRLHGTIAAWLLAQDALCAARPDLDALSFDWSARSIYHKVYASKEAERQAATERLIAQRRLPANRPPPPPPLPPGPARSPEEEMRDKMREARGERPGDEGSEKERKIKGEGKDRDGG